ncbi:hypothetical protein HanRHA438_Chr15g0733911 [Helianthus annuus]|nr:hypothetical protein HanRHA438_Chr15g0733911 [Helianthus annuus]
MWSLTGRTIMVWWVFVCTGATSARCRCREPPPLAAAAYRRLGPPLKKHCG